MRKVVLAATVLCLSLTSACAWLTRDSDDIAPEKMFTDEPCAAECCCKTKRGYYAYFRCQDRIPCESAGGTCERNDLARCARHADDEPLDPADEAPGADGEGAPAAPEGAF